MLNIKFLDSKNRINGKERRSKLLDPNSELYQWVDAKYTELVNQYGKQVGEKWMDYHIELIGRNDVFSDKLLVDRCQELENVPTDLTHLGKMGRAYVLWGPAVSGYGQTHITIAFFPDGVPAELLN